MRTLNLILGAVTIAAMAGCAGEGAGMEPKTAAAASTTTTATDVSSAPKAQKDIVDTAVAAGKFTTLVAAVKAAGLVDTLKSPGPFTVFAPTDDAFAKLPPGTVDALLKDKAKLTAVLTYHVVSGNVGASQAMQMSSAKTVQGKDLAIKTSGGTVMINDAKVVMADVQATNGVIHAIDTVLMPPM